MKNNSTKRLTFSAILIALGVLIPMVMPIKVVFGPASFTLASHVPVFISMFISPGAAIAVALGTAFGFFITFPPIVAFRALSHAIFAVVGAFYLQKNPEIVLSRKKIQLFNFTIGVIHAFFELLVVSVFFTQGNMSEAAYNYGYLYTVLVLVGFGGLIHSIIDFLIAFFVGERLSHFFDIPVFRLAKQKEKSAY